MIDRTPSPYPPATWRLLITPPTDGATNMAIDEAILYALAAGHGQPTIRFFQWEPACLSLGYSQSWHDLDEAALRARGYTWTRRPTGGRAILHTDEATYSLILPQSDPRVAGGILPAYRALSYGLLNGLARLGVEAQQASKDDIRAQRRAGKKGGPVCFDTPSRYEITWDHRKLIGSAQLRRRQIVLQHGSLPLCGDLNRILDVLAFSPEQRAIQADLLPRRATTLAEAAGRLIPFDTAVEALSAGFREALNLTLSPAPLTAREHALAEDLRRSQYANDAWNKRL